MCISHYSFHSNNNNKNTSSLSKALPIDMNFDQEFELSASTSSTSSTSSDHHHHHDTTSSPSITINSPKRNAGRKKFKETRHPIYRGVRQKYGTKWVCEVRVPNNKSRIWLGTYPTPEMAARAHDAAALALRGKSAQLNFPDSPWLLPRAKSTSASDIRLAAVQAAQAFRPTAKSSSSSSVVDHKLPCVDSSPNKGAENSSSSIFWDEEAMFNMPSFLDSMAEGLLLPPPAMQNECNNWHDDLDNSNMDLSLW